MNKTNIIIDNDGDAINLNDISIINKLIVNDDKIELPMINLNGNSFSLSFHFEDYGSIEKDVLVKKINKIRNDIIIKWNNGNTPVDFFNAINLSKNENE